MTARPEDYTAALQAAARHANSWLASVPERPIPARRTADELGKEFGEHIPDGPTDPAAVIDLLAEIADGGLLAIGSGRFFGWVMGGTLPAALAADWLVSAWDQNAGMRTATPGVVAAEEVAGAWLLDLLGLPPGCAVGFVTVRYLGLGAPTVLPADDRGRIEVAELAAVLGTGSRWADRAVIRVSVSNWATDGDGVAAAVDAVRRAVAATG